MSHKFFDGIIYHKRFLPVEHTFKYKFFMLDIDLSDISSLKNTLFSTNKFNLFSFLSKDHFGQKKKFLDNVDYLLKAHNLEKSSRMHFVTLPRIMNFVFNPISLLIINDENNKPSKLLAEVHNYNGGRVIYNLDLEEMKGNKYKGIVKKDMYVSPFFNRVGDYEFTFKYTEKSMLIKIDLYENKNRVLCAYFNGNSLEFSSKNVLKLFFKHTFLTFFVVTRTIWQSLKLKRLGLVWKKPTKEDQIRRY